MNLWADFLTHKQRPINKWKHYFPIFERHFKEWVYKPVTFMEIGCGEGGSLQMWKRYFGPHATIIGIDIREECKSFEEDQIEIRIGSQDDPGFLQGLIDEFGPPDIVIDDGSHHMAHVSASFEFLYPQLSKNGIYMVEDLHTAYWSEFAGGVGTQSSFIERCKHLIDELNAVHSRGAVPETLFSETTMSMHFYDSVVVFERGCHTRKCGIITRADKSQSQHRPGIVAGESGKKAGSQAGESLRHPGGRTLPFRRLLSRWRKRSDGGAKGAE